MLSKNQMTNNYQDIETIQPTNTTYIEEYTIRPMMKNKKKNISYEPTSTNKNTVTDSEAQLNKSEPNNEKGHSDPKECTPDPAITNLKPTDIKSYN